MRKRGSWRRRRGGEGGREVKKSESRSATLGKAERKGDSRNKGFGGGGVCSGRVHGEIYGENKGGNMEVALGGRTPGEEEQAWKDQDFRKKKFASSHLLHHFIPFRVTGRGHIWAKAGPSPG